ncbi:hypothetical protein GEV33_003542 [Tenebrio molitor]|uniref:DDE Tnp4 domain-containing protein n=1 Tax=Tenebrio molitor TaxID=7067 RepID=A0A8J6LE40_TENMO|nr:hypothetical protein GEV33_003542 [Tenebrio molitor]
MAVHPLSTLTPAPKRSPTVYAIWGETPRPLCPKSVRPHRCASSVSTLPLRVRSRGRASARPMGFPPPLVPHINCEPRLPVAHRTWDWAVCRNALWTAVSPVLFLPEGKKDVIPRIGPPSLGDPYGPEDPHPVHLPGTAHAGPKAPLSAPATGHRYNHFLSILVSSALPGHYFGELSAPLVQNLLRLTVDPVAPRGGLGGVYTIRSRQTTCRGVISGGTLRSACFFFLFFPYVVRRGSGVLSPATHAHPLFSFLLFWTTQHEYNKHNIHPGFEPCRPRGGVGRVSLFLPPPYRQPLIDIHTHPWPGEDFFLGKNPPPSVRFEPTSAGTATSEHCLRQPCGHPATHCFFELSRDLHLLFATTYWTVVSSCILFCHFYTVKMAAARQVLAKEYRIIGREHKLAYGRGGFTRPAACPLPIILYSLVLAALVVDELVNRGDSDSDEEEQKLARIPFSIQEMSERNLFQKTRLDRRVFNYVLEVLTPSLERNTRRGRYEHLTPTHKLYVALQFYASGGFQWLVGGSSRISQSAVSNAISEVTSALVAVSQQFIRFPTAREFTEVKQAFYQLGLTQHGVGFPNVLGVIDCISTIRSMFNYLIAGPDLKIYNVFAEFPGSNHDSYIWRNSAVRNAFEEGGTFPEGWLVAHSGYPQEPWIMTPVANATSPAEHLYNSVHISTRNPIERTNGVLRLGFQVTVTAY